MTDYLGFLAARETGKTQSVLPRLPSRFEAPTRERLGESFPADIEPGDLTTNTKDTRAGRFNAESTGQADSAKFEPRLKVKAQEEGEEGPRMTGNELLHSVARREGVRGRLQRGDGDGEFSLESGNAPSDMPRAFRSASWFERRLDDKDTDLREKPAHAKANPESQIGSLPSPTRVLKSEPLNIVNVGEEKHRVRDEGPSANEMDSVRDAVAAKLRSGARDKMPPENESTTAGGARHLVRPREVIDSLVVKRGERTQQESIPPVSGPIVHVTIGKIEVRSGVGERMPHRSTEPETKGIDLQDYLRRRSRGGER